MIRKLQKYGIIMADGGCHGYENGFQIISGHTPYLLEAMKWVIIDLNIQRAKTALQNGYFLNCNNRIEGDNQFRPLEQVVYDSYPSMFRYFYHLEKYGTLSYRACLYDKAKHGLEPFGLEKGIVSPWDLKFIDLTEKQEYLIRPWRLFAPTKKVKLPPSHFG